MYRTKISTIFQSWSLIALINCAVTTARVFDNSNGPELPEQCGASSVDLDLSVDGVGSLLL
jgi:hypothetical protein